MTIKRNGITIAAALIALGLAVYGCYAFTTPSFENWNNTHGTDKDEAELALNRYAIRVANASLIATYQNLLLTVITAAFAAGAAYASWGSLQEAKKTARAQLRAYVGITEVKLDLDTNRIWLTAKNFGQTPAHDVFVITTLKNTIEEHPLRYLNPGEEVPFVRSYEGTAKKDAPETVTLTAELQWRDIYSGIEKDNIFFVETKYFRTSEGVRFPKRSGMVRLYGNGLARKWKRAAGPGDDWGDDGK